MARPRTELDAILRSILGSKPLYFQPPENLSMTYPCLRYEWDRTYDQYADNGKYILHRGYMLTYIGKDPNDPILDRLLALPLCSFVRRYVADTLNHTVFLIYF